MKRHLEQEMTELTELVPTDVVANAFPNPPIINALLDRRSVHPKRLIAPGPNAAAIQQMADCASTASDHGGLRPWRLLAITGESKDELADIFATIKLKREPAVTRTELERERDRARAVPVLLTVVSRFTQDHPVVPISEQCACIGAAIQNILLCADILGFGAKMVSGRKVREPLLAKSLQLMDGEALFGFVCIGTIQADATFKARLPVPELLKYWGSNNTRSAHCRDIEAS